MMKLLKNEKLARWIIGIVVVGLVMAYVPLLFVPQQIAPQQAAPQTYPEGYLPQELIEPQAQNPIEIVTSSVGVETSASSSATGTPE